MLAQGLCLSGLSTGSVGVGILIALALAWAWGYGMGIRRGQASLLCSRHGRACTRCEECV